MHRRVRILQKPVLIRKRERKREKKEREREREKEREWGKEGERERGRDKKERERTYKAVRHTVVLKYCALRLKHYTSQFELIYTNQYFF